MSRSPGSDEELEELIAARLADTPESEWPAALERLCQEGRLTKTVASGETEYTCDGCFIPPGAEHGWEAAVFDHYQAMVTAICAKLQRGQSVTPEKEYIGGSTYSFFVTDNHPLKEEVLSFLQVTRQRAAELRRRVAEINEQRDTPQEEMMRVIAYVGQTTLEPEQGVDQ